MIQNLPEGSETSKRWQNQIRIGMETKTKISVFTQQNDEKNKNEGRFNKKKVVEFGGDQKEL